MDKFFNWFNKNRRAIGFTIGGLCLLSAISNLFAGDAISSILYLLVGTMIIADAKGM